MADKKKGYLKSTVAKDALFNKVTPILFKVHKNNHRLVQIDQKFEPHVQGNEIVRERLHAKVERTRFT